MFRDREWKWNELSFQLSTSVKDKISATSIQLYGSKEDTLIWKATKNGEFSATSTYELAKPKENHECTFLGKWVWEIDTMPKIAHSYGCVTTTMCTRERSLLQEVCNVTLPALCAEMALNQ